MDKPCGTLWKLDVDHTAAPVNSGIIYGQLLGNTKQDTHPKEAVPWSPVKPIIFTSSET